MNFNFEYVAFTLYRRTSQTVLLSKFNSLCSPNPKELILWFGLFRFRSPLLTESMFLSLPPGT